MLTKLMKLLMQYAVKSQEIVKIDATMAKAQDARDEVRQAAEKLIRESADELAVNGDEKTTDKLKAHKTSVIAAAMDVLGAPEGEELQMLKQLSKTTLSSASWQKAMAASAKDAADAKKAAAKKAADEKAAALKAKADAKKAAEIAKKDAKLKAKLAKSGITKAPKAEKPKASKSKPQSPTPETKATTEAIDAAAAKVATEAPPAPPTEPAPNVSEASA